MEKIKILFVCTMNKFRSATAHQIYQDDVRFFVKSAGIDTAACVVLTEDLLEWADVTLVMERYHRNKIRQKYPNIYKNKKILCLYIPDEYEYMQKELISELKAKMEDFYNRKLLQ